MAIKISLFELWNQTGGMNHKTSGVNVREIEGRGLYLRKCSD